MKQLVISALPKDHYIFKRRSKYTFFISAPPKNVNYNMFLMRVLWFQCKTIYTLFMSYTKIGHTGQEVQMKQLVISAPPKDLYIFQRRVKSRSYLSKSGIITKSISIPKPQESPHFRVIHWPHYATAPRALGISTRNHSAYNQECPFL